jgi:hypothetical protein
MCQTSERSPYTTLLRKCNGKRPLGIFRRRWKNNIEMYLKENKMGTVD